MSPSILRTCSITPRLQQHLMRSGVGWDVFCLCPAQLGRPYVSRLQITHVANKGPVAYVDVHWFFGAIWYASSFVVRYQRRWLVDDIYCAGHPETSIYRPSSSGCRPTIPASFYPRGTATAMQAVLAVVRPFYGRVTGTCSPMNGMVFTCPVTQRLLRSFAFGEPSPVTVSFCRCQNPPTGTRSRQIDNTGRVAHVNVSWYFGGPPPLLTTTFVVLRERTGWLVDDQYCAGRPRTSIYSPTAGSCR